MTTPHSESFSLNPHSSVGSSWLDGSTEFFGLAAETINTKMSTDGATLPSHDGLQESTTEQRTRDPGPFLGRSTTTESTSRTSQQLEALSMDVQKTTKRTGLLALLIILVGAIAGSAFLAMGVRGAKQDAQNSFQRRALKVATEIEKSWRDYETAALWIHESCRNWRTTNYTRQDFAVLYKYIRRMPLEFHGMEWVPKVTHEERDELEQEGKTGWVLDQADQYQEEDLSDHILSHSYTGFMGQEPDPENPGELVHSERSNQTIYYPIHFAEPMETHLHVAHYDLYSAPWERPSIDMALQTGRPALTERFQLLSHRGDPEKGYSVVFYHPGPNITLDDGTIQQPKDLATMVIHIQSLLHRAARFKAKVYLYDKTPTSVDGEDGEPAFLSALEILDGSISEEESADENLPRLNTRPLPEQPFSKLSASHDNNFYFEQDFPVGGRTWVTVVVPSDDTSNSHPGFIILSGVLMFVASLLLAAWMIQNMRQSIRIHKVMSRAAAEATIVSEMFPANVRGRLIQEAEERNQSVVFSSKHMSSEKLDSTIKSTRFREIESVKFREVDRSQPTCTERTEEFNEISPNSPGDVIFGGKAIAELHPYTTVMYANLCGFTAWASTRTPSQVFLLLEVVYHSFDLLAKKYKVFKVETVGDHYIAATGLPKPRKDHAVLMAKFATECLVEVQKCVKTLETSLGPDTGELGCKFGLHSGQVVGGVLRGDKGRFQLFGDTVIKASVMESAGVRNKIQVSAETAELLAKSGRSSWLIPREEAILLNGKSMPTSFLHITRGFKGDVGADPVLGHVPRTIHVDDKTNRLIEWNVGVLSGFLRSVVARRNVSKPDLGVDQPARWKSTVGRSKMVLNEVQEVITFPRFNARAARQQVDIAGTGLDSVVKDQLQALVTEIAAMYRDVPFHSFEHVSHCTMSVTKMMERIVNPRDVEARKRKQHRRISNDYRIEAALNDHTFGITSDPLSQFSCVFAALVHDLDHQGVQNKVLVAEKSPLAEKYQGKSVAEQNSVDLAWELLLKPEYEQLRNCLCSTDEELTRFRSLVVNSVMATDISDKELNAARSYRWHRAFSKEDDWAGQQEGPQVKVNRKATIVIEYLIQASDVAHTMQHWSVYQKWNERLFHETYKAYMEGRIKQDPTYIWYDAELEFFDEYVIPLAKKLYTCGVFGLSSDEFLNYAVNNRKEWVALGEQAIQKYLETYEERYGI